MLRHADLMRLLLGAAILPGFALGGGGAAAKCT
jgi:hypothetical protein